MPLPITSAFAGLGTCCFSREPGQFVMRPNHHGRLGAEVTVEQVHAAAREDALPMGIPVEIEMIVGVK